MKVIFYGNEEGNFFDKLIRWWTSPLSNKFNGKWKSSYSHCEILFSDGYMFSASQYENKTRYVKHNYMSGSWHRLDISHTPIDEERVRAFCDRVEGNGYDYFGILGFVIGVGNAESKWFCSEVCTRALQDVMTCDLVPHKTSPNDLFNCLDRR